MLCYSVAVRIFPPVIVIVIGYVHSERASPHYHLCSPPAQPTAGHVSRGGVVIGQRIAHGRTYGTVVRKQLLLY